MVLPQLTALEQVAPNVSAPGLLDLNGPVSHFVARRAVIVESECKVYARLQRTDPRTGTASGLVRIRLRLTATSVL